MPLVGGLCLSLTFAFAFVLKKKAVSVSPCVGSKKNQTLQGDFFFKIFERDHRLDSGDSETLVEYS